MITVACVFVKANVPYTVEYLAHLRAMVRRHLARPHELVCFTDRPGVVPAGIRPIRIAPPPCGAPGWWAKLELFNRAHALHGRVLYLDLDTLIVNDLAPIADWPAPFATIRDTVSTFQGRHGRAVVKGFNSSVMVFDAGTYADLFETFTPAIAERLWGDQDRLAELHPNAATLPEAWFPRLSAIGARGDIPAEARVVLSKKPKNLEAAARWPWFDALWRAA